MSKDLNNKKFVLFQVAALAIVIVSLLVGTIMLFSRNTLSTPKPVNNLPTHQGDS